MSPVIGFIFFFHSWFEDWFNNVKTCKNIRRVNFLNAYVFILLTGPFSNLSIRLCTSNPVLRRHNK